MNDSNWEHLEETFQQARASIEHELEEMAEMLKQARLEYRNLLAELEIDLADRKTRIEEELMVEVAQAKQKATDAWRLSDKSEQDAYEHRVAAEAKIAALTQILRDQ